MKRWLLLLTLLTVANMAITRETLKHVTKEQCYRGRARFRHAEFIDYTWQKTNEKFTRGIHTVGTCNIIDQAFEDYRNGISSFIKVLICFRHGKSDMSSRYLPPHFLGEFPDDEVIVTSYNATKAFEFSKFGRRIIRSPEYKRLYPAIELSNESAAVEEWGLDRHTGKAQYFGIGGGSAGKGGNLIVIDDYFANRADSESETMREKTWNAFTDDILTRRAPVCIVLLVVTPWHCDDICARIDKKMKADKNFPQFKTVRYPAFKKSYKKGRLFPERFDKAWYVTQRAALGTYGTASLMQCDPKPRSGNMLRTDKFKFINPEEFPSAMIMSRAWDLASSEKQLIKDDPDFTVGIQGGVIQIPTAVPGISTSHLYINDIVRGQWEAPKRKQIMLDTAIADGFTRVGIEAFAAYKDAYTEMADILKGIRTVEKMQLPGDKVAKASCLEPICEAGNIYFNKNIPQSTIAAVIDEMSSFPGGAHDDIVDAMAVLYHMSQQSGIQLYTSAEFNKAEKRRQEEEEYKKKQQEGK